MIREPAEKTILHKYGLRVPKKIQIDKYQLTSTVTETKPAPRYNSGICRLYDDDHEYDKISEFFVVSFSL